VARHQGLRPVGIGRRQQAGGQRERVGRAVGTARFDQRVGDEGRIGWLHPAIVAAPSGRRRSGRITA
jgi:hypothetical protein